MLAAPALKAALRAAAGSSGSLRMNCDSSSITGSEADAIPALGSLPEEPALFPPKDFLDIMGGVCRGSKYLVSRKRDPVRKNYV